jgi:GxxExxY protein
MRECIREAAEEVFDELGPGWSESIYHKALIRELGHRGIPVYTEGSLSVMYKGGSVGTRRPDLMVQMPDDRSIMVELKSGSNRGKAQLMQYLDMAEKTKDLGEIRGGAVIRFNDEVEYEFIELGPEINPDDRNVDTEQRPESEE